MVCCNDPLYIIILFDVFMTSDKMSTFICLFLSFYNDFDRSSAVSNLLNYFSFCFTILCYDQLKHLACQIELIFRAYFNKYDCRQDFVTMTIEMTLFLCFVLLYCINNFLFIKQCLSSVHICVNESEDETSHENWIFYYQ
jgi:hypothetical protein